MITYPTAVLRTPPNIFVLNVRMIAPAQIIVKIKRRYLPGNVNFSPFLFTIGLIYPFLQPHMLPIYSYQGKSAVVYGRDIVTGLPVEREIPTPLVDECLTENFNTIIDNVKVILERTPPELAADIYRHGVYLTGGASQVNHLAELLSSGTGLKVQLSENPTLLSACLKQCRQEKGWIFP